MLRKFQQVAKSLLNDFIKYLQVCFSKILTPQSFTQINVPAMQYHKKLMKSTIFAFNHNDKMQANVMCIFAANKRRATIAQVLYSAFKTIKYLFTSEK